MVQYQTSTLKGDFVLISTIFYWIIAAILLVLLVKFSYFLKFRKQIEQESGCRCMVKGLVIQKSIISSEDFFETGIFKKETVVGFTIQTRDNTKIDLSIDSKTSEHLNRILAAHQSFDEIKEIIPFKEYTFIYFLHQIGDDEIPTILSFS